MVLRLSREPQIPLPDSPDLLLRGNLLQQFTTSVVSDGLGAERVNLQKWDVLRLSFQLSKMERIILLNLPIREFGKKNFDPSNPSINVLDFLQ